MSRAPVAKPSLRGRRRWLRFAGVGVACLLIVLTIGVSALWLLARDAIGGRVEGARLARIERSPHWREGQFQNRLARVDGPLMETLSEWLFGGSAHRFPDTPVPLVARAAADYATPPSTGLRVTWFGHSTSLLEIDGQRVLIDPVWGARASPLAFAGPKRYFTPPLPLAELPAIDAVLISHDHYDHLDRPTILALAARGTRFVVPLGIGAHLEKWGVPLRDVVELDWWESTRVGGLTLTSTPSRHFSGRLKPNENRTLWTGWSIAGAAHRAYYSGDTALDDTAIEIGARLGPFDLTMIEVGEYDALWSDVHLGPEQAVRVHALVGGRVMLPVHWAGFDLALHGWTEPIERVLVASRAEGVRVATPLPGELLEPTTSFSSVRWWPVLPWRTVQQAPAFSTSVAHLLAPIAPEAPR